MVKQQKQQQDFLNEYQYKEEEYGFVVPQQVTIIHNHYYGDITHTIHINDKRNK